MEFCEKCGYIEPQCQCEKPVTNADRIRNMTDEELAKFLAEDVINVVNCCDCDEPESEYGSCIGDCKNRYLKWLQTEVEEEVEVNEHKSNRTDTSV